MSDRLRQTTITRSQSRLCPPVCARISRFGTSASWKGSSRRDEGDRPNSVFGEGGAVAEGARPGVGGTEHAATYPLRDRLGLDHRLGLDPGEARRTWRWTRPA